MKREIKFRAWDTVKKIMYPSSKLGADQLSMDPNGGGFYNPDPVSTKLTQWCSHLIPMQYTNLKDKNGKEIYEGDIVKFGTTITVVTFVVNRNITYGHGDCTENLHTGWNFDSWGKDNDIEVIGNLYENPERL